MPPPFLKGEIMDNTERIIKTLTGERSLHPANIPEALARWDAGESLFSVEMGGLGPGYEQAIQIAFIELLRACFGKVDAKSNIEDVRKVLDEETHRISKEMDLRLSGAQAGVAQNLAWNFLQHDSWVDTLNTVAKERLIQISKRF